MKSTFYISAIYTSPPTTMGGNTKIMLEIIDNLSDKYNFVIFTTEPLTFKKNLKNYDKVTVIAIDYPFSKFAYKNHLSEINHITKVYEDYFAKNSILLEDYFYSCSDFAPDVLPIYELRKKYPFTWIASLFLFIPNPLENLARQYGFPIIKYIIYFVYQKYIFSKILQYADLFIITNDYDRKYFPKDFTNRIFAIYGGVNGEDILSARKKWDKQKKYDAVFCSRLHPQKGIDGLLDIWGKVVEEMPQVKLAVIGNGEKVYEEYLKKKAARLGIEKNIDWLGYVNGRDKYLIYLQSRIFLHGTIYDNNGMVAAEALCTGLPVIMYDLPQLKTVYTDGCTKVPIGDQQEYANTIIKALSDNQYYVSITLKELQKVSIETSWKWGNRIKLVQKFLRNK